MKLVNRRSTPSASGLCILWLVLAGSQAAPAAAVGVTPADPTIPAGQTQQFTASGVVAPTGVGAGGEYTCVPLPDGTVQCTGRNQFGQHGNGTIDNSPVLGPVSDITTATRVSAGDEYACALLLCHFGVPFVSVQSHGLGRKAPAHAASSRCPSVARQA